MNTERKASIVIFAALLFVVNMDLVLHIRMRIESWTTEQIMGMTQTLGLLSLIETILIVTLLGILTFLGAEEAEVQPQRSSSE